MDYEFRVPTPKRQQLARSEDLSGEIQDEQGVSRPAEPTDDAEARADFWSVQGDFIYRHHNEPRVQLYVPKEETFSIQLIYIDVTRSTRIDLDVLQAKRIDDYWNVDSSKHLPDSCRGSTKFTILKEKPPKDTCGPVRDWQRLKRLPDHIMQWPEVWTKIGKAA